MSWTRSDYNDHWQKPYHAFRGGRRLTMSVPHERPEDCPNWSEERFIRQCGCLTDAEYDEEEREEEEPYDEFYESETEARLVDFAEKDWALQINFVQLYPKDSHRWKQHVLTVYGDTSEDAHAFADRVCKLLNG